MLTSRLYEPIEGAAEARKIVDAVRLNVLYLYHSARPLIAPAGCDLKIERQR